MKLAWMAIALLAVAAGAQVGRYGKNGGSFRGGIFFPNSSEARDAESDYWLTFGVDVNLARLRAITQDSRSRRIDETNLSVSADYIGSGSSYSIPILLNTNGGRERLFYSAGVGVAFNSSPNRVSGNLFDHTTGTDLAFSLMIGMRIREGDSPIYAALRYNGTSGEHLNGVSALVGVRF